MRFPAITGGTGTGRGHDGAIDGYLTVAIYFPGVDAAVAVVVNNDTADLAAVVEAGLGVVNP